MNATLLDHIDPSHAEEVFILFQQAWWCTGRDIASTAGVIEGSTQCFGLVLASGKLVAFARVLSDRIEKATIYDIIIDENFRSKGFGRQIIEGVLASPVCKSVRHIELYCADEMIDYYAAFGFTDITHKVKLLRRI